MHSISSRKYHQRHHSFTFSPFSSMCDRSSQVLVVLWSSNHLLCSPPNSAFEYTLSAL